MTTQTTSQATIESVTNQTGKSFFDGKKRPSAKWMLFMCAVIVLAGLLSAFMIVNSQDTTSSGDASTIGIAPKKEDVIVGGKATPEYNNAVTTKAMTDAEHASANGSSYVPTPVNSNVIDESLSPEPPKPKARKSSNSEEQQELLRVQAAVQLNLKSIMEGMELKPQETHNYLKNDEDTVAVHANANERNAATKEISDTSVAGETVKHETIRLPGGIHAGSILYATNDLKLSSDGKNPVVRATILSGPLKNYIALGAFENGGESLTLAYSRLVSPEGKEFNVEAYAIDPSIPEANVASDVDHHYLSRWGGFMAASFLNGFANATQMSGISSGGYYGGSLPPGAQYGLMNFPTYSLMEKGVIGLGEVGRQVGSELKQGINRPATVTLDPGIPLGILIIGAGTK